MQVFVSEYLTCGAMHDEPDLPASLLNEGRAMHAAIVTDFAQLDGVEVVTTWDDRLPPPHVPANVTVRVVDSVARERESFFEAAQTSDETFVIAPEFNACLLERSRWVAEVGGHWLGCEAEAIEVCADKLQTARILDSHGVSVVPTTPIDADNLPPWSWPVVVKPLDGAGSVNVRRIHSKREWRDMLDTRANEEFCPPELVQPYVNGRAMSVAAIVSRAGSLNVFPVATQELTNDFAYTGGEVSTTNVEQRQNDIAELVKRVLIAIPGLTGYFGIDFILSDDDVTIIEINPRLTTSYLGYRQLTAENLADRLLATTELPPIIWRMKPVRFAPSEQ